MAEIRNGLLDSKEREGHFREAYYQEQQEFNQYQEVTAKENKRVEEEKRICKDRRSKALKAALRGDIEQIKEILDFISSEDRRAGLLPEGSSTPESVNDPVSRALVAQHRHSIIECSDVHGYTPLLEAAIGGHVDCANTLLRLGADINRRGKFGRTPLFRAAFAGHVRMCKLLLENGADPRIADFEGLKPEQIDALPEITSMIENWCKTRIDDTNKMLEMQSAARRQYEELQRERINSEIDKLRIQLNNTETECKNHESLAQQLEHTLETRRSNQTRRSSHSPQGQQLALEAHEGGPVDETLIALNEQLVRETEIELRLEQLRAMRSHQAARDAQCALAGKLRELEEVSADSSSVRRGSVPRK